MWLRTSTEIAVPTRPTTRQPMTSITQRRLVEQYEAAQNALNSILKYTEVLTKTETGLPWCTLSLSDAEHHAL